MTLYIVLDLLVLGGPLLLSFDRRVGYVRFWPSVALSTIVVGVPFLAWDVFATRAGVWRFSPIHTGSPLFLGLPPGEVLFFFVVPFSCLFIYEVLRAYLPDVTVQLPRWPFFLVAVTSLGGSLLSFPRAYTSVVFGVFSLFFLLAGTFRPGNLLERTAWLSLLVSFIPFGVVNGILTAFPIVLYNPSEIIGVRVFSIPLEDFFYNFSMFGLLLLVHGRFRERLRLGFSRRLWVQG